MATIAELKGKIEKMQKVIDNPDTSPDIKKSLELGVKGAKEALAKLEAEEKKEPSAKPDEKKEKASPTARKEARSALDKCRELLKKYEDKKESDADRVEKRRKAGKPAELTPAEAVSKGAKSVKSKVVDMTEKDKHLKKAEINAMVSAIVETVKSTISGIEGAQARDEFINSLIDQLSDMKSRSKSRAESGMFVDTSGPGVKDKVISWIGMNREKLEHYTDTEFIIHMMEIINHFPHAVGIMKMGGSIPDVEFTVMHEGRRTKVIAKSVREARMKGAEKLGADPEEVSAVMSSYDIHADMFSYHPDEEMADGGMMARGGEIKKEDVVILGVPRNKITEKEWQSILRMAKYQDGATYILKDEKGLDVVPQVEYEWYLKEKMSSGGMMARGGRPLSAINRDRAYQSDEEWEKNYKRRSAPSNPRYNTED